MKQELNKTENKEIINVDNLSPFQQMQQAHAMGMSVDDIKNMLALQKNYEETEAKKAFHFALAEFKKNPPKVVKDKLNKQFGSTYASIGNLVNTVNAALGEYGLNVRWSFPEPSHDRIYVTCILAHKMGHEVSVTLPGPVDSSGSKNELQGRKSARTYLKIETFEAVTGIASVDGNVDDDANSVKAAKPQLQAYSKAMFTKNKPKWEEIVKAGKKTDDIINMVSTKYILSEEQKSEIRGLK